MKTTFEDFINEEKEEEILTLSDSDYDLIYKKLEYTFKKSNNLLVQKIINHETLSKSDVLILLKKFEYTFRKSEHELLKRLAVFTDEEYIPVAYSNIKSKIKRDEKID